MINFNFIFRDSYTYSWILRYKKQLGKILVARSIFDAQTANTRYLNNYK